MNKQNTVNGWLKLLNLQAKPREGDYRKEGILYCGKCNTPRETEYVISNGTKCKGVVMCKCRQKSVDDENNRRLNNAKSECLYQIQKNSGAFDNERARESTFEKYPNKYFKKWCSDFVSGKIKRGDGIIITGGTGSGKTTAIYCMMNYLLKHWEFNKEKLNDVAYGRRKPECFGKPILFIRTTELFENLRMSFKDDKPCNIVADVKNAKLLFWDDLGTEKPTEWVTEKLYDIIDFRYANRLSTIITTNMTMSELQEKIGPRIADRIKEVCKVEILNKQSLRKTYK